MQRQNSDFLDNEKATVLIVDDDRVWCRRLKAQLEEIPLFYAMEPIHAGDTAIEVIELFKPDVIVLDLIVPIYDGMYIVDYVDNMPNYQPVIYVVSIVGTEKTHRLLRNCDVVDSYSIKPVHTKSVVNTLCILLTKDEDDDQEQNTQAGKGQEFIADGLDWLIEDWLRKLGIRASTSPAKCARAAIEICIRSDKDSRISMMALYKQAGQVFTPPLSMSAVERNIRTAVEAAKKARSPLFEKYFYDGTCVNNGIFVQETANELRRWIIENGHDRAFTAKTRVLTK